MDMKRQSRKGYFNILIMHVTDFSLSALIRQVKFKCTY